jgi:hypothetical protein
MTAMQIADYLAELACLALAISMLVSPFVWRIIDFIFGLGLAVFAAVTILLAAVFDDRPFEQLVEGYTRA